MFSFQGTILNLKRFNEIPCLHGTSVSLLFNWQLTVDNWQLLVITFRFLIVNFHFSIVNFHFSIVNFQFSIVNYLKWWAKMDSLSCGKATAVTSVHRTLVKSRLSSPFYPMTCELRSFALHFCFTAFEVVGQNGLEPSTSRLSVVCSSQLSYWPVFDFLTSLGTSIIVNCQLSIKLVEISGIEPLTSCLQGRRSPSWAKPPYLKL